MPLATGGTLTTVTVGGITYNIHTFNTSGTLTFTDGGTAEYLIVGGGGGGGRYGGGGGAGGFLTGNVTVTATSYNIVVGSGGSGHLGDAQSGGAGISGGNSSAFSLTAIGGGGGGNYGNPTGGAGLNGGSGGGGGLSNGGAVPAGGLGTLGQGNNGGSGLSSWNGDFQGGGGGGAGAVGFNGGSAGTNSAGRGGVGLQSSITGTATYYAGGGGGSTGGTATPGGLGGGGSGLNTSGSIAADGTSNTGGGGGGTRDTTIGGVYRAGNGGSGVVIVRYATGVAPAVSYPNASGGTVTTTVVTSLGSKITYKTHLFTSSGNLTVSKSGTAEYLIVGAGGGGGSDMGGGGGAGGYLAGNVTLNTGTYTVTVGAGGIGAPSGISQVRGSSGSSSSLVPFGFKGHSYSFDGSGDGVNCGTQSAYAIGSGAFCLEGWIYNHRLKNYSCLWTTRPDNGTHAGAYHIGWNDAGGVSLYVGSTSYAAGASGSIKAGQWQHIAVTRNASGNLATFVDGVRVGYTASLTTNFTNSLLGLGDFPTTKGESIDGYISNARIVVGNAVYDPTLTTCTVPTAPLTAISGTAILTAQDLAFQDNSVNNFTLTAQGNTALSHYSPFHALGAAGGGGGASEYSNNSSPASSGGSGGGVAGYASTTNGLGISGQGFAGGASGGQYYPSGGGGAGAAGSTNPANGGIGRINAILGTSYYWAGGGGGAGYSGNPGNGGLGGGGGGAPRQGTTAGLGGGSAYNSGIDATAGSLNAQTNVPGGNGGANTGGGGGGGAHYNSNNFGGTGGSGIVVVRYIFNIEPAGSGGQGGPNAGGGGGAGNDGYIGRTITYQVKVFTSSANLVVNSSSPVEYLIVGGGGGGGSDMGGGGGGGGYLAGTTTLSAGTYLVTVGAGGTGGPAGTDQVRANSGSSSGLVPFGYTGHSYMFDGIGDYMTLSTGMNVDSEDFTVQAWVYVMAWTVEWNSVFSTRASNSTAGATDVWVLGVHNTGYPYIFSGAMQITGSAGQVTLRTWTHLAVTRSGSTMRLFVNGTLVQTTTSSQNYTQAAGAIGANRDGSEQWTGFISNLQILKGSALYTASFTVPTSPLTANASTILLTAQDLSLRDNSGNNRAITAVGNATTSHFSPFHSLGAAGGGGGASDHTGPAATSAAVFGGSGGGASGNNANNGLGIPGQGNQGAASAGSWYPGGGGGAGAAGSTNPANGGNGLQNAILGTSYYWAAGGGGAGYSGNPGNGGLGGGGGGAPKQSSTVGVAGGGGYQAGTDATSGSLGSQTNVPGGNGGTNTGSGGGGGSHYVGTNQGGSGGSGIVIVKYRTDLASITTTSTSVITLTISQLDTSYGGGQGANGAALYSGSAGTLFGGGGGGSGTGVGGGGGGISVIGVRDGLALGGNAGGIYGGDGQAGIFGYAGSNGNGGLYGGGGGGTTYSVLDPTVGNGANGALVIFWQGNVLQYPTVTLANNTTAYGTLGNTNSGSLISGSTLESLETGVGPNLDPLLRVEARSESRTTANSNLGILTDSIANANIKSVLAVNSITTNASSTPVNNIAVQELQIITYRTDDEMMLVTVQNTGGYTNSAQRIDRVTEENDPRRVKAYLLNYIVGVTGEDNDIIQTQIWF